MYNVFGDVGATITPVIALPVAAKIGYQSEYLICTGLVIAVIVLVVRTLLGEPSRSRVDTLS